MRELVLLQPGKLEAGISSREGWETAAHRELEQLLRDNGTLANRVAFGVLRNAAEAEDVAQEALFRACRKFDKLRDPKRFRGWLARMTFRLALDRLRSVRRREERETRWAMPELRPPVQTVEELAVSREFETRLARALDELPGRLRIVILLAGMEGHSVEEVADMVGVPVGTVKSRLFTARERLAEKLR
jgi:RNA polymerase sigma-70 factor (ECF subfamily)